MRRADVLAHPESVRDAPGQQLIIYQAEPGSSSAQALALLGTLAVTRRGAAESA